MSVAVKHTSAEAPSNHLIGGHSLTVCLNVNESGSEITCMETCILIPGRSGRQAASVATHFASYFKK